MATQQSGTQSAATPDAQPAWIRRAKEARISGEARQPVSITQEEAARHQRELWNRAQVEQAWDVWTRRRLAEQQRQVVEDCRLTLEREERVLADATGSVRIAEEVLERMGVDVTAQEARA